VQKSVKSVFNNYDLISKWALIIWESRRRAPSGKDTSLLKLYNGVKWWAHAHMLSYPSTLWSLLSILNPRESIIDSIPNSFSTMHLQIPLVRSIHSYHGSFFKMYVTMIYANFEVYQYKKHHFGNFRV